MMDRGKKVLLKTFWCSKGWRYEDPAPEEYRLALEAGYFLPVRDLPDHETAMARLRCLLDLTAFLELPKAVPTRQDWDMLRAILAAMGELPPTKKAGAFRDLLVKKKIIPANRQEISTLLDILGICGVLSSREHPCAYVKFQGSNGLGPQEHTNDFTYPVSYWHVSDGVDEDRFQKVFGFPYGEL